MNANTNVLSHEEVSVLLPWLSNGSLSEKERKLVMEHAGSCIACRREFGELEALQSVVAKDIEAFSVPAANIGRMLGRIEEYEERRATNFLTRLFDRYSNLQVFGFFAQAIAAMLLLAVWMWPEQALPPEANEFTLLTGIEDLQSGNYLRAVFKPEIAETELNSILSNTDLRLVSGPSNHGVYLLEAAEDISTADLTEIVSTLRADPDVSFAVIVRTGDEL